MLCNSTVSSVILSKVEEGKWTVPVTGLAPLCRRAVALSYMSSLAR